MDLNKVMLIGRITKDPDARTTPTGQSVASFSVATNLRWKDQQGQMQERGEFHNIVAWRKLADICKQYLHKGSKVYIEGRLQTRSWQDQQGVTKYRTEVVADNMIMLDSKGSGGGASFDAPPPTTDAAPTPTNNDEEIKVENIPF
ncbi:MAG: single-stranded DNA-binding protein [bacterium]|nr:single-stranded DNA-binding protein [bacterium]